MKTDFSALPGRGYNGFAVAAAAPAPARRGPRVVASILAAACLGAAAGFLLASAKPAARLGQGEPASVAASRPDPLPASPERTRLDAAIPPPETADATLLRGTQAQDIPLRPTIGAGPAVRPGPPRERAVGAKARRQEAARRQRPRRASATCPSGARASRAGSCAPANRALAQRMDEAFGRAFPGDGRGPYPSDPPF